MVDDELHGQAVWRFWGNKYLQIVNWPNMLVLPPGVPYIIQDKQPYCCQNWPFDIIQDINRPRSMQGQSR